MTDPKDVPELTEEEMAEVEGDVCSSQCGYAEDGHAAVCVHLRKVHDALGTARDRIAELERELKSRAETEQRLEETRRSMIEEARAHIITMQNIGSKRWRSA